MLQAWIRSLQQQSLFLKSITALGGKQALWDTLEAGWEKKGELATTSLEFENICIKKVDVKC